MEDLLTVGTTRVGDSVSDPATPEGSERVRDEGWWALEATAKSDDASRLLINSDLRFSQAVLTAVVTNIEKDETASWLALSHLQYLALIAYEIRQFSAKTDASSNAQGSWSHELALAASRHSSKLFNDTKKTQAELLGEFVAGARANRSWFVENNRAPWLFRGRSPFGRLVNDTSVLLYDGQMLCTSQSISFHARLDLRVRSAELRERAEELAAHLSGLASAGSVTSSDDDYFRGWHSEVVVLNDARYENLYAAMFPEVSLPDAMALAILRCDLFGLKLMREMVALTDSLAPATFKLRYAGVWQVVETLRALIGPTTAVSFSTSMRHDLDALLSGPEVHPMRSRGARQLRNILVHYGLGRVDPRLLDWNDPLLGLPEVLMDGTNWLTADQMLDDLIVVLLSLLDSWAGPVEHTLEEPHE